MSLSGHILAPVVCLVYLLTVFCWIMMRAAERRVVMLQAANYRNREEAERGRKEADSYVRAGEGFGVICLLLFTANVPLMIIALSLFKR